MNHSATQFALRELRMRFASPLVLGVLAAMTVVLAISGPFNTLALMPLPQRLAYWALVTPATYGAGLLGSAFVQGRLEGRVLPRALPVVFRATGSTLLVAALLFGFHAAFGFALPIGREALASVGAVLVICLAIEVIGELADSHLPKAQIAAVLAASPALLARLPLDKRGGLVCISAIDHYIEVTTTKGSQLILMRLSDAIAETAPAPGLQIHRSHWVALDQVRRAVRVGDGASLTLTGDKHLPVARTRMAGVAAAGLFARKG